MEIKTMEDILYNQMGRIFEIRKINESFGEKYLLLSQKNNEENLKGRVERYCVEDAYEMVIFKTKGILEQKLYDSKSNLNILRIVYCINGECKFSSDNGEKRNEYTLKKDNIMIQRRSRKRKEYNLSSIDFECLILEFYLDKLHSNLSGVIRENEIGNWEDENIKRFEEGIYYNTNITKEIKTLLLEIQHITNVSNINKFIEFKSKILQLFPLILEQQKKYLKKELMIDQNVVVKIKEIINGTSIESIPTIKELCKILSLSRYQIHTIFEKNEGIGILEYIQRKKMEQAKKLLKETDKSILHISNEIGYENPSKFSRAFKKYYGILPSKYKMEIKK